MKRPHFGLGVVSLAAVLFLPLDAQAGPFVYRGHHDPWHGQSHYNSPSYGFWGVPGDGNHFNGAAGYGVPRFGAYPGAAYGPPDYPGTGYGHGSGHYVPHHRQHR